MAAGGCMLRTGSCAHLSSRAPATSGPHPEPQAYPPALSHAAWPWVGVKVAVGVAHWMPVCWAGAPAAGSLLPPALGHHCWESQLWSLPQETSHCSPSAAALVLPAMPAPLATAQDWLDFSEGP